MEVNSLRTIDTNFMHGHCEEIRESTHVKMLATRGVNQQILDNGRGKVRNHEYEPIHYVQML